MTLGSTTLIDLKGPRFGAFRGSVRFVANFCWMAVGKDIRRAVTGFSAKIKVEPHVHEGRRGH